MTRGKLTRYGCDMCKHLILPTYIFKHGEEMKLWICEGCLEKLLEWKVPT